MDQKRENKTKSKVLKLNMKKERKYKLLLFEMKRELLLHNLQT